MKSNKIRQDERALRLADKLRRHINKEAGRLKAEVTAELRHTDETKRARKAVLAVRVRLDEVISTLEDEAIFLLRDRRAFGGEPARHVGNAWPGPLAE